MTFRSKEDRQSRLNGLVGLDADSEFQVDVLQRDVSHLEFGLLQGENDAPLIPADGAQRES